MMSNSKTPNLTQVRKVRYHYVPVREPLKNEETEYISYGISVRSIEEEIAFVSDISTDLDQVKKLAELCTEQELSPEHLGDVVEDFLNSESLCV